ncbi:acid phosphatase 1-like [Canna indica]|uniref:Acid phosphatase 1-like n=1 Tax=Canna indica TaxID=4628 RepID=A0AAQ3JVB8_9LILI|nr:acid phosphatase 1-like [Canna indica]
MGRFLLLIFLLISISAAADRSHSLLRTVPDVAAPADAAADDRLYCGSWWFSVETNNARFWRMVPPRCRGFVEEYMSGDRYASDSYAVAAESLAFAESVRIADDGKDAWVFDVDETLLSNIPYYAVNGYGSKLFNETSFNEWVSLGRAPALPASLRLYEELLVLGFQIVLLTGRSEAQRKITEDNLSSAGYHSWRSFILREACDIGKHAVDFKSERRVELEAQGFRIQGCSGDQWSDLLGSSMAKRSFKLPNPMYYID